MRRLVNLAMAAILGFSLCWFGERVVDYYWLISEGSAVAAISDELVEALQAHYREHGAYPSTVDAVTLDLTWSDGASGSTLRWIRYVPGDHIFALLRLGRHPALRDLWICRPSACERIVLGDLA